MATVLLVTVASVPVARKPVPKVIVREAEASPRITIWICWPAGLIVPGVSVELPTADVVVRKNVFAAVVSSVIAEA